MKKHAFLFLIAFLSFNGVAQEKSISRNEVTKEIKMEDVNGEKVLTISTNTNGTITEEVFKGEAADKKLAELQNEKMTDTVNEQLRAEIIDDQTVVTITKTVNGEQTVEVLKGAEAEAKLKEMDGGARTQPLKKSVKIIEVKEIESQKKN